MQLSSIALELSVTNEIENMCNLCLNLWYKSFILKKYPLCILKFENRLNVCVGVQVWELHLYGDLQVKKL